MQKQVLEYKEKKEVINFYELQAETYDIIDGFSYWEILYSEYKDWIEANLSRGLSNIAEFGCGTGLLTKSLNNKAKNVFGVDICKKFLKKSLNAQHQESFLPIQGDIKLTPYIDNVMDAVVCLNTFDHINNPEKIISEANRVCKKNGLFLFDITSSTAIEPYYRLHYNTNEFGHKEESEGTVSYEWSIKADDSKMHKINTYRHRPQHIEEY